MRRKTVSGIMLSLLLIGMLILASTSLTANALYQWSVVSNPIENEAAALTSVYMVNSNDGWAVGWLGNILHWDGSSWSVVSSPTSYDLFSVFMVSSSDGWAVGADGTIIRWDGDYWGIWTSPTTNTFRSVFMTNSNEGWAVGEDIVLYLGNRNSAWCLFDTSYHAVTISTGTRLCNPDSGLLFWRIHNLEIFDLIQ